MFSHREERADKVHRWGSRLAVATVFTVETRHPTPPHYTLVLCIHASPRMSSLVTSIRYPPNSVRDRIWWIRESAGATTRSTAVLARCTKGNLDGISIPA